MMGKRLLQQYMLRVVAWIVMASNAFGISLFQFFFKKIVDNDLFYF